MEDEATSWDLDEVTEEELDSLVQYEPTEEELGELSNLNKPEKVKLGDLLSNIAKYASKYVREPAIYTLSRSLVRENPLEGEAPYNLNNATFVYWVFEANGILLSEPEGEFTIQMLRKTPRFKTIYPMGSSVDEDNLLRGDLIYFNNDRHVGIYLGAGEFISMNGPSNSSSAGGIFKNKLNDPYWSSIFQGHVERLVR